MLRHRGLSVCARKGACVTALGRAVAVGACACAAVLGGWQTGVDKVHLAIKEGLGVPVLTEGA